ncbi:hypothetical protein PPBDW_I21341 [Photobacterium kishitanii]|nr:hypothetical protein PPBDW_I21341 [Photobacterium kishitanii]
MRIKLLTTSVVTTNCFFIIDSFLIEITAMDFHFGKTLFFLFHFWKYISYVRLAAQNLWI